MSAGQPPSSAKPALLVNVPKEERISVIIPESPPFPQDVEFPPFAVMAEASGFEIAFVICTIPPFPPSSVPSAPLAVIVDVVEVATVIFPPFPPFVPSPPFEIRAFVVDL